MDFEWQTRGPGDVTSPFYQLGLQHENKKRKRLKGRGPAEPGQPSHDTSNNPILIYRNT